MLRTGRFDRASQPLRATGVVVSDEPIKVGRRSTDADLAVLAEWREGVDDKLDKIHLQTLQTNGRVSELEVKERIRQDREEQAAIRSAAAEAARFRVEEHAEREALQAEERHVTRITWRMMLLAAAVGATPAVLIEAIRAMATGHL